MLQVETIRTPPPYECPVTVVRVRGDLDLDSAPNLMAVLNAACETGNALIISLEDCSYCDSSGLAVLIGTYQRQAPRVRIVVPRSRSPYRIFALTNLNEALRVVESVDAALTDVVRAGVSPAHTARDADERSA